MRWIGNRDEGYNPYDPVGHYGDYAARIEFEEQWEQEQSHEARKQRRQPAKKPTKISPKKTPVELSAHEAFLCAVGFILLSVFFIFMIAIIVLL